MTTQLFFAKRKPRQCPACKSKNVASIMYGYPSSEVIEQVEKKIVLGGCCITDRDPSWQCVDCQIEIYKEFLRDLLLGTNSREEQIRKARELLSDEQLVAFFKATRNKKVHAIEFINKELDSGMSLDKVFYTGEMFGWALSVRKLAGEARFKISFGYAGGDVGDGGEWKVEFNGNEVILIESGVIRIS